MSTCAGFIRGLYVPRFSTKSLSIFDRVSATTTRKKGFFFEPTRRIRIVNISASFVVYGLQSSVFGGPQPRGIVGG
jgi:hypothetical protein